MKLLVLTLVLGLVVARPQKRQDDLCGRSSIDDAGREPQGQRRTPAGYVVGGWDARENELPFAVSLQGTGSGNHFCGASMIAINAAVTAAHCTEGSRPALIRAALGEHNRVVGVTNHRNIVNIQEIIDHADYNGNTLENDISLLMFDRQVYNNSQWAACLPDADSQGHPGEAGIIAGWGVTEWGGTLLANTLQITRAPIMTFQNCQNVWVNTEPVFDGMMCVGVDGQNERDACQGDSGGPVAVKIGDSFTVVGATSWGFRCASIRPGVYTNITHYVDWIERNLPTQLY